MGRYTNGERIYLGVIGAGNPSRDIYELAEEVGKEAARRGWVVVTGGLGGVMEAAAKGASEVGGLSLGILPGGDRKEGNIYQSLSVVTHLRHARNSVIAHTSHALIAVDGQYGTLSEIALGLKLGRPVVGLRVNWNIPGVIPADSPGDAVDKVSKLIMREP